MKKKYVVYAVALLLFVAIVAGFTGVGVFKFLKIDFRRIRSGDEEAPIIVKNGSIDITAGGVWKQANGGWVNDTGTDRNRGDLWVKVTSSDGSCNTSGQPVHVDHSDPGVGLNLTTASTGFGQKTVVTSQGNAIRQVSAHELITGNPGQGHIAAVRARTATCSLSGQSMNVEIRICSSTADTRCQ
jgi:hypothetical protein